MGLETENRSFTFNQEVRKRPRMQKLGRKFLFPEFMLLIFTFQVSLLSSKNALKQIQSAAAGKRGRVVVRFAISRNGLGGDF